MDRRSVLRGMAAGALAAGAAGGSREAAANDVDKPNILFISIDDLNDWVGILGGHAQADTPHLDALAARAVSFENAHCAAPVCNPSRVSVMTGLRPSTSGVYENDQPLRKALPTVKTLPQYLRDHGYRALSSGKIFHSGDPDSWDLAFPTGCSWPRNTPRHKPRGRRPYHGIRGIGNLTWGPSKGGNGVHSDSRVADWVIDQLKADPGEGKPFFLACGFFRPHLPWFVPRKYFWRHPLRKIVLPTVLADDHSDIPAAGRRLARVSEHEKIVASEKWADAVQAYLASVSYADHQLGRVLRTLQKSEHAANTVVIVWSDHGWSLGEKMHWKKFALWEECTRVPVVIHAPGVTTTGETSPRTVSLLDLFPTVCELAGVPAPAELEGKSLVPLLQDPESTWSEVALTTHGLRNHAVRDERHRYIRYADGSEELYDHDVDPHEFTNLAGDETQAAHKARLAAWLPSSDASPAPKGDHACARGGEGRSHQ